MSQFRAQRSLLVVLWLLALAATAAAEEFPAPSVATQAPSEQLQAETRALAYYHYALGHLYEELAGATQTGQSDYLQRAIEEYKQALKYDPDSTLLTVHLAEAYRRSGRIREAVLEAQGVLKNDPENLPARRLLARIYLQTLGELQPEASSKRTLQLAIEQYEVIARLAPHDFDSLLALARLYRMNNQMDKAEETLKTILEAEPRSEDALTQLAMLYSDQGEYEKAIALLRQVTDQAPTSELLTTLASAYQRAGDLTNAIATYRRALTEDPENAAARRQLAQALLEADRYDEAIQEYQALVAAAPNDFLAHLRLSQLYRHRRRFDQASEHLARARALAPDNLEVSFNQALLYEAQGEFGQAVEVLSDMVASMTRASGDYDEQERRTRAILLEHLGSLHRQMENFDAAVETYELLRALGEEEAVRASHNIIESLRQARRLDAAIARARQAVEQFSEIAAFKLQLAALFGDRGDLAPAVELVRALLTNTSSDREAYLALAQIYERNKRYGEAETAVAEAEKLAENDAQREYVFFLRGAIYERQKKYDLAEQQFRRVLAMNPKSAITLNYLGYMLADRGVRLEESVELVKQALEIEPYNGAYLDSLGWAYYQQGKLDLAEEYLLQAVARVQRDPTVHDHLGDLYHKLQRAELAQKHWERSLAEWKAVPKTEFDPEAFAKVEAKLRALKNRSATRKQ